MTISRIVSGGPLHTDRFRSQARAKPDILAALAGGARRNEELATGRNPTPKEGAATITNPQAKLGHDHSGPPWGSSFLHPIAWFHGIVNSDIQGARLLFSDVRSDNQRTIAASTWNVWVPPFDLLHVDENGAGAAPRSRLHLYLIAKSAAGTPTLTVTLRSDEHSNPTPASRSADFALTTSEDGFFDNALYLDAIGGRHNRVGLDFLGSHASNACVIVALALCVQVKRAH